MRLLLRANSHRPAWAGGSIVGVEVAASPDTPARPEPWAWHIRLLDDRAPLDVVHTQSQRDGVRTLDDWSDKLTHRLALSGGRHKALEVAVDRRLVGASTELVHDEELVLERPEEELLAVVVSSGAVVVERRHTLGVGDAVVLTGDDPLAVSLSTARGAAVVVRLNAPHGRSVSWVP